DLILLTGNPGLPRLARPPAACEVQRLHRGQVENHLAVELTRTFFQQRHLNIRHALTKAGKSTVMLKGHVDVQEVHPQAAEKSTQSSGFWLFGKRIGEELPDADVGLLSLPQLWVRRNLRIHVYVLTVRGLQLDANVDLGSPYVVVRMHSKRGPTHVLPAS
ncbi:unnamed protein product, partial [Effrenium voratum]